MKDFNSRKKFSFLLTEPTEIELIEKINYSLGKLDGEMIIEENVDLLNSDTKDIFSLIKKGTSPASTYNILTLPCKGEELKFAVQFNELISVLKKTKN